MRPAPDTGQCSVVKLRPLPRRTIMHVTCPTDRCGGQAREQRIEDTPVLVDRLVPGTEIVPIVRAIEIDIWCQHYSPSNIIPQPDTLCLNVTKVGDSLSWNSKPEPKMRLRHVAHYHCVLN